MPEIQAPIVPARAGHAVVIQDSDFIRPSEIRAVWRGWSLSVGASLTPCRWVILDSIYSIHGSVQPAVEGSLQEAEPRLEKLKKRAATRRNVALPFDPASSFDCDDIAFYLRGWINGRALHAELGCSFCFGVAVMDMPADKSDPLSFGAASSHVLNWLIIRDNPTDPKSNLSLKFVDFAVHNPDLPRIHPRPAGLNAVPDLVLKDATQYIRAFEGGAGVECPWESVSMILI